MTDLGCSTISDVANDDKLLVTKEAAEMLGVSPAFLERDRCYGPTIPYIKVGARAVRYRLSELLAYIERNTHASPAEPQEG